MIKLFEEYKKLPDIPSNIMHGSDINIDNFVSNGDGTFTYDGNLNLQGCGLKELPDLKITIVKGYFKCNSNKLTSLKNIPEIIKGSFWCDHNKLISLMYAPAVIGGDFKYNKNLLLSLNHNSDVEGTDNKSKAKEITELTDEVLATIKKIDSKEIGKHLEFFRQRDKKAYDLMREALNELNINYIDAEEVDSSGMF